MHIFYQKEEEKYISETNIVSLPWRPLDTIQWSGLVKKANYE